jgi:Predicted membrane protein (DUF2214)
MEGNIPVSRNRWPGIFRPRQHVCRGIPPVVPMLLRAVLSIPDVGQIDAFVEPWRRLYAHSPLLSTLILFGHLGGLFAAGGLTVAADRATLRLDPSDALDRRRHLSDLARLQRPVWLAFLVALVSGALLFLADVEAFAGSPIFWTKMALVMLLVVNAGFSARLDSALRREEDPQGALPRANDHAPRWRRRRAGAAASVVLWFGLVLVGTALATH